LDPYLWAIDKANGTAWLDCLEKSVASNMFSTLTIFDAVCVVIARLPGRLVPPSS
jgi:hypothetical protein